MVNRNISVALSFALLCNLNVAAQLPPAEQKVPARTDNYQLTLLQNNAFSLVNEVAKHCSELPKVGDRIDLRVDASSIIWKYDPELSGRLLDKAWEDTYSKEIDNEHYRDSERKKIINAAAKFSPERSIKWLKDTTVKPAEKPEVAEKENDLSERQRGDLVLRAAITRLGADQPAAVALALSTLTSSGRISAEFVSLINALAGLKRQDLIDVTYKRIEEFVADRATNDVNDLRAVTGLIFNPHSSPVSKTKLLAFLINSGRQIVIVQNSNQVIPKLSAEEIWTIYRDYYLILRPFVQRFMAENLLQLDLMLKDLSAFIPTDKLSDPLLNQDPVEKQIDDALKTAGTKERDIRLLKIASWLLSRRKRDEVGSIALASGVADKVSDPDARSRLRDYIKLAQVERLAKDKELGEAENVANHVSSPELRGWTLLGLGDLQKSNSAVSTELYDDAQAAIEKGKSSSYKTQLAILLSSIFYGIDKPKSIDNLRIASKYSIRAEKLESNEILANLLFSCSVGRHNFDASDLEMDSNDVELPSVIGKLGITQWNNISGIIDEFQPQPIRLKLQLILSRSALDFLESTKGQTYDHPKASSGVSTATALKA